MVAAVATVVIVGWADRATGTQLRIFPLYFVPVALTALRWGRLAGVAFGTLSAAAWAVSNGGAGIDEVGSAVAFANTVVMLGTFVLVALLLAEQREVLQRERALSRADSMTGLANSRAFFELARTELMRSQRYSHPLTVAYFDLDDFKAINDAHGHGTGDAVLTEVATVLRSGTRPSDVVARLGGDEFVVLFPETGREAAEAAVGKLKQAVEESMRARGWAVTASVGAVTFERPAASVEELVSAADAVMYRVKSAGKNGLRCEVGTASRSVEGAS